MAKSSTTISPACTPRSLPLFPNVIDRRSPVIVPHQLIRTGTAFSCWNLRTQWLIHHTARIPPRLSETPTSVEPHQLLQPGSSSRDFHNVSAVPRLPRSSAKDEIDVSRPHHRVNTIAASLPGQPGRHIQTAVDCGEARAPDTPFAGFISRPETGFTLSPSGTRSNRCRCTIRVEAARQTSGKPERSQMWDEPFLNRSHDSRLLIR